MAIRYVTNADGKGWPKGILGKFLSRTESRKSKPKMSNF